VFMLFLVASALVAAPQAAANPPAPAPAAAPAPAVKPKKICRIEDAVTGSITPKRVCVTVPQVAPSPAQPAQDAAGDKPASPSGSGTSN